MKFPAIETMYSLLALAEGEFGNCYDDGAILITHSNGRWKVKPSELDELESLGWIELAPSGHDANTATLNLTDKGKYWLKRWKQKVSKQVHPHMVEGR
jgi:DNA-binding PadR family transcriptional regulator